MVFKLNISDSEGRSWKLESESEFLVGKSISDKFDGGDIKPELEGYELHISGGSDHAGFPLSKNIEGIGLKKVLLKRGWGMRVSKPSGLRLRKTVRGRIISASTVQVNLKVVKEGKKSLVEIFPEQNKPEEETKNEAKPRIIEAQEKSLQ